MYNFPLCQARTLFAVVTATLTVSLALSGSIPASAQPSRSTDIESGGYPSRDRVLDDRTQADIDVDLSLSAIQEKLTSFGNSEDIASAISYEENLVTIYAPSVLRGKLSEELGETQGALQIKYVTPEFSVSALTKEGERLSALPGVSYAGPNSDYSGIEVGLPSDSKGRSLYAIDSPFPVTTIASSPLVAADSRNNSGSDSYLVGGSLIAHVNTGVTCSTGILVTYGGQRGVTTAAHCPSGAWRKGGVNVGIGSTSTSVSQTRDIRIIGLSGVSSIALIADGGWSTSGSLDVYRAASNPTDGQRICTNGAMTGTRCGQNYVRGINKSATYDGYTRTPGFWILSENIVRGAQECNGMRGDSGSPVFTRLSTPFKAEVHGFAVAIDPSFSTAECYDTNPNYPISVDNKPSARTFAINVQQALASVNATPLTR